MLAAVLLAVVLLLLVHGVVMGVHHFPEVGCATCLVAIAAALVGLLIGAQLAAQGPLVPAAPPLGAASMVDQGAMPSRHPPRLGTVLRL